jgi:hypothetical protein
MSFNVLIGATQTGGTSTSLSSAGISPGKSMFVTPDHSRLIPETVEFTVSGGNPTAVNPGTARTGLKISFANRTVEEGCCTVTAGSVIMDLGIRWDLSQPETVVDDVIAWLRGVVYSTQFADAVKKGVLPT